MEDIPFRDLAPLPTALTRRQMECMQLVRNGLTSKQIARELGISPRTVDQHIAAVIDLLQVNNRMAAVTRLQQIELASEGEPGGDFPDQPSLETDADDERAGASDAPKVQTELPAILPALGGWANAAPPDQRRRWMVHIAILSVMMSCVVTLTILGVSELASGGLP